AYPFGQDPRLGGIEGLVDLVGVRHDLADGAAVFAAFEIGAYFFSNLQQRLLERGGVAQIGQLAVKVLADEIGRAAGDIDVLADQVAVHARDEIVGIEVQVFDVRVQLGGNVIAHPLGVHADVQVAQ